MANRLLILGDNQTQIKEMERIIAGRLGFATAGASCTADMSRELQRAQAPVFDLAVISSARPLSELAVVVESLRRVVAHVPVIMVTDFAHIDEAGEQMQLVADLLVRPLALPALARAIANAMLLKRQRDYIVWLEQAISGHVAFADVLGEHASVQAMRADARRAAQTSVPAVIVGEAGSGKEWLARAIHGGGARAGKPFVVINCASLPPMQADRLIFGAESEFAGGEDFMLGKLREADGGTLLIKEPNLLPLPTRQKLMAAIAARQFRPLGSARDLRIDVRFIFSQHEPASIDWPGSVMALPPIAVPPLRARAQDIPMLAEHFLSLYAASEQKYVQGISPQAMQWLANHPWPGNVGQLSYLMRRAVLLSSGGVVELADVRAGSGGGTVQASAASEPPRPMDERGIVKPLRSIEEEAIRYALEHCGGNMTGAARSLGIGRSTLYRKVSEMDINAAAYISRANQTTRPTMVSSPGSRS